MNKLDLKIDSLCLSTRVYNAVIRGIKNLLKKEINEITIRDLISLDCDQIRHMRNLGNKGFSELLTEVHLLGLKFDFELDGNINYDINTVSMEECLFIQEKYLSRIKHQQEQIRAMQEELTVLQRKKNAVDGMILMLKECESAKKLRNINNKDCK